MHSDVFALVILPGIAALFGWCGVYSFITRPPATRWVRRPIVVLTGLGAAISTVYLALGAWVFVAGIMAR